MPRLAAWNGHGINMKANAAVCALASGSALVALALGGPRRLVRALASITLAIGALTLLEHLAGLDLGIDRLLFDEAPGAAATAAPGRMGPPAATSFTITAVALWLMTGGRPGRRAASALALIPVAIAALGTVGYAFGASQLFAVARFTGIALQTATILAALGVGLIAAVPEHGLAASLGRDDPGGVLLRRLIAPVTLSPLVLGFLRLLGERAGYYDTAFGTAVRTLIEAALLIGVTWWTADGVSRQALAARQAEEAMREARRHKDESARRAERAAEHLRRLHDLTSALGRAATTEEVAATLVDAGRAAVGAAASFAWLLSDDGRTLRLVASRGFEGPRLDAFREIPFDTDVPLWTVIRSGRPLMFGSLDEMERQFPALARAAGSTPFGSWAALPLTAGGRSIGGVSLSFAEPRSFAPDDRELLEGMTAQASLAVERCVLFEAEKAARARAEQADRRKDEFLAMLGHELRNPLAPISTALQLMRLRNDDVALRERMIIERQVSHLERLVDDLLDVSRITRGRIELERTPLDVASIVTRSIEQVEPLLEQRSHRLVISVPRDRLIVDGDPVRLAQVISNLLTNAAKYTEPGGEIQVSASREGGEVVVRVRDTGVGIAPELLPHVFDLFTQAPQTLARSQGGLGLGLAIVRRLVELHGGRVEAHSAGPGAGSEFLVALPCSERQAPLETAAAAPTRQADGGQARRRILVVDDNEDAAQTLAEALRDGGHDVRVAEDGPRALASAAEFAPDVVLLDIGLPVMDGYEVARQLRQRTAGRSPRLFAVTGYGQDKDRATALAAGFDDHIVKPVDLDDLFARLARLAPRVDP